MLTRQDIYHVMHADSVHWDVTADVPGAMVWQRHVDAIARTQVLVFTGGPNEWRVTVEVDAAGWIVGEPLRLSVAQDLLSVLRDLAIGVAVAEDAAAQLTEGRA